MPPPKSAEYAQPSTIFADLIADLSTKDTVLPISAKNIIADEIQIMTILQKARRIRKPQSFANLALKEKTHEMLLVD